ncbi:hypothetical protein [Luteolibacter sp. AS25]|uniref:hypothetical protein n=1 Tax=Luteolibacter sp. AS25 TaxID=3135776 RepID=UPI00398AF603
MNRSNKPEYSIRSWLLDLRKNGLAKHSYEARAKTTEWKSALFLGIGFVLLGLFQMWAFREGLTEWWRVVSLSYEEVSKTPYLPIWTSGRGAMGALFVVAGLSWVRTGFERKKQNKSEMATPRKPSD